jgi:hypothetical protein
LSTGDVIKDRKADQPWTQFAFPPLWHYDVLRALDYLRAARVPPDARVEEAVAIVCERRQDDGRWLCWIGMHVETKRAMSARRPNQSMNPTQPLVSHQAPNPTFCFKCLGGLSLSR